MANGIGGDGIVDNVEISAQQELKRFLIQRLQVFLLGEECFLLNEFRKENLDLIEIAVMEQFFLFRRRFENPGNCLIIEQQMNAIHALGE